MRSDIVIISQDEVSIFELTVPLDPHIKAANFLKTEKYSRLAPFEIGSRGYISPENKNILALDVLSS